MSRACALECSPSGVRNSQQVCEQLRRFCSRCDQASALHWRVPRPFACRFALHNSAKKPQMPRGTPSQVSPSAQHRLRRHATKQADGDLCVRRHERLRATRPPSRNQAGQPIGQTAHSLMRTHGGAAARPASAADKSCFRSILRPCVGVPIDSLISASNPADWNRMCGLPSSALCQRFVHSKDPNLLQLHWPCRRVTCAAQSRGAASAGSDRSSIAQICSNARTGELCAVRVLAVVTLPSPFDVMSRRGRRGHCGDVTHDIGLDSLHQLSSP